MGGRSGGLLALTAVVVLSGCAADVAVEAPDPDPATAALCQDLVADLPTTVVDQPGRNVAGDPDGLTAAWGTPAITLRCGVTAPAALQPDSQCYEVDGVGWFAEEVGPDFLFTTIGRTAFVEVGVPARFSPQADVLVDVAAAVAEHVPVEQPCV